MKQYKNILLDAKKKKCTKFIISIYNSLNTMIKTLEEFMININVYLYTLDIKNPTVENYDIKQMYDGNNKISSYFKVEKNTLIRFDRRNRTKQLIKFKNDVKLKQKFMSGESFITVFDKNTDETVQYDMPVKEREILLINNNVSLSDFGKFVIKKWKELKGENITQEEKDELDLKFKSKSIISASLTNFNRSGVYIPSSFGV
jgi:hypothetical protein